MLSVLQRLTRTMQGFRMIVGDPELRSGQGGQKQLCHRCEANIEQNPFGGAPCTGSDTFALPSGTCGGGIRATITFPTCVASSFTISTHPVIRGKAPLTDETTCRCWDGKNVDSPDHKSHVAYPSSGSFESSGPCPASHPVKLPQVMYEVMWDTRPFNNKADWPADGSQPFVYSMGDK